MLKINNEPEKKIAPKKRAARNNDSEGCYSYAGNSGGGKVHDSIGSSQTALLEVRNIDTKINSLGYCVDMNTLINPKAYYHPASNEEIAELFPAKLVSQLRKLINSSYPVNKNLKYLEKLAEVADLSEKEAIMATQAAIWSLVTPAEYHLKTTSGSNAENVIKLYKYLLKNSLSGWEKQDLLDFGEAIQLHINSSQMALTKMNDYFQYGPFVLDCNKPLSQDGKFDLEFAGAYSNVCFADAAGNTITQVKPETQFYIIADREKNHHEITFTVSGTYEYGMDARVIFPDGGKSASQSLVMLVAQRKDLNAECCFRLNCLELIKTGDCVNEYLEGAVFELCTKEGHLLATKATGKEGRALFCNLLPGNYTVKEKIASDGCLLDTTPIEVLLNADDECENQVKLVYVCNKKQPGIRSGHFRIRKYDKECRHMKLAGAVFHILDGHNKLAAVMETKINEFALSSLLPFGTYKIVEVKAPEGYKLNNTPVYVEINTAKHIVTIDIANEKKEVSCKGQFFVQKCDALCPCYLLADATFAIHDENSDLVGTITTDKNGFAASPLLDFGKYRLDETIPPLGYEVITEPIFIEIDSEVDIRTFIIPNCKKD